MTTITPISAFGREHLSHEAASLLAGIDAVPNLAQARAQLVANAWQNM